MKVLIACECSGVVRRAFRKKGHDAWSCDLQVSDDFSDYHIQDDAVKIALSDAWDLMIAHPPCTHLSVSGARWFKYKHAEQKEAVDFFMSLVKMAHIKKIAVENPVSIMSSIYRKPDQIIQPWQFGHGETKATCLWLKNLPLLKSTNIVTGREAKIHRMGPSPDRAKKRSITYQGIADAMSEQWSDYGS